MRSAPASSRCQPGARTRPGPKALRASAGAIFRVPVVAFDDAPRPWTALATRGGPGLGGVALPTAGSLVLGAEREGLPEDIAASCEAVATIPQAGAAESLNVAMAGSIAPLRMGAPARPPRLEA